MAGLMHHLPDILYVSALKAFRHECYSESILSFTAAFERTCEIFTKAFSVKNGASPEQTEEYWSELKGQSERQYGAFCQAYFLATKQAWKANKNKISFRNSVVHKGHIATRTETEGYASYITSCIDSLISILGANFADECTQLYFFNKRKIGARVRTLLKSNPGAKFVGSSIPSPLGWNLANREKVTFESALRKATELEQMLGH